MLDSLSERLRHSTAQSLRLWTSRQFVITAIVSLLILYVSTLINTIAGITATQNAGAPTTDIILSNIGRIDTSFIHGPLTEYIRDVTLVLLFVSPRYLPFGMKTIALFTVVRAAFVNMTHIGIYPDAIPVQSLATFGGDLFFSGHVGASIIAALIFWDNIPLRYAYIVVAIVLGASALLGHYHYTVDVFSAPFIAYGIFVISKKLFRRDYLLLKEGTYPQHSHP